MITSTARVSCVPPSIYGNTNVNQSARAFTYDCFLIVFFRQVRYKLGLSDDEEDEIDSADQPRSDKDLCHPLCQCEKCCKWQKVCDAKARHAKHQLVKKHANGLPCYWNKFASE